MFHSAILDCHSIISPATLAGSISHAEMADLNLDGAVGVYAPLDARSARWPARICGGGVAGLKVGSNDLANGKLIARSLF